MNLSKEVTWVQICKSGVSLPGTLTRILTAIALLLQETGGGRTAAAPPYSDPVANGSLSVAMHKKTQRELLHHRPEHRR